MHAHPAGLRIRYPRDRATARTPGLYARILNAILVTHEHSDHVGSAHAVAAKFDIPVWTSHGTYRATENLRGADRAAVRFCRADDMFCVGDLQILPYTVPHDAREPLQFVFNDGARRLGVLTDAGMLTEYLCAHLAGMHALVLECNHDREMLANSAYPWSLKRRIGGDFGHLANDIAAAILTRSPRRVAYGRCCASVQAEQHAAIGC